MFLPPSISTQNSNQATINKTQIIEDITTNCFGIYEIKRIQKWEENVTNEEATLIRHWYQKKKNLIANDDLIIVTSIAL